MELTLSPAILSGRSVNGVRSEQGMVVHVVRCNAEELKSGLVKKAYTLSSRTQDDKNGSCDQRPYAVVTCPKCRKKAQK